MNKIWKITKPAPREFIDDFPEFSPIVLQLLYQRGIRKERDIEQFLNPDWERDLFDPFLMKGMKESVKRIKIALKKKERVGLFGHFDVDGITSTVLFTIALQKIGLKTTSYIPDREEGYGITEEGINEFAKENVKLLVTGDCGISAQKEVEIAKSKGMDVIITDHHEIPKKLPKAYSIINPKQKECKFPYKDLAGVGVAFKLIQALSFDKTLNLKEKNIKWLVDLVGLGTICDVVPLTSENRLFAKFGLIVLNKTRRVGLLKLYQKAKIVQGKIDPYAVSFMIGPRLNAPGRMDHANVSYYLLSEKREEQAERLAQKLEENNQERQRLLKKILEQAKNDIKKHNLHKNNLIMVGGKDWPSGIIGLVAGKLKDEYCRPVLALAIGDKQAKGSARSIDNFHITEMLSLCSDCLIQYGGHKRAAGFSLINENIATLKEKIIDIAERKLTKDDLRAKIGIDAKIDIKDISWRLFEDLEKFEPTGFGNPRPVFLAENVLVDNIRLVGKQANHLKMKLAGFDSIFFSGGEYGKNIREGDAVDIVFQIDADDFMAERKLQLKIIDMRKIAQ